MIRPAPGGCSICGALSSLEQFASQRAVTTSLLEGTDTALQNVETLLLSAKRLALRGVNDTLVLSSEPHSRVKSVACCSRPSLGNSDVNGRYLFAGQANDQPPFSVQAERHSAQCDTCGHADAPGVDDLTINGVGIRATQTADDPLSTVDAAASARAVAAAINAATPSTGVQATVGGTTRTLTVLNFGDLAGNALTVNGVPIAGTITDASSWSRLSMQPRFPGSLPLRVR